jgi:hypothetical protein
MLTPTYMRPSAFIPDWRAGLRATSHPHLPRCGRADFLPWKPRVRLSVRFETTPLELHAWGRARFRWRALIWPLGSCLLKLEAVQRLRTGRVLIKSRLAIAI